MPVITVKVSAETAARLERLAAGRPCSKSEVIRDALAKAMGDSRVEASAYDWMRATLGSLDSGTPDLGSNPRHLAGFGRT
jgi:predicted transcriptional regulator